MKRAIRFSLVGLVLCLAIFAACAKREEREGSRRKERDSEQAKVLTLTLAQQETIGLMTAKAVIHEVRPVIESFGRVIPRLHGRVQVASPVAGRITAQSVNLIPSFGAFVHKGQLLAEVEQTYTAPEQVQLDVGEQGAAGAVQEAQAALEAAAAEYERSQHLFQAKIVSRKRLEEAKAAWLQAQSRYETARRQQASYHTATTTGRESPRRFPLTAPLEGVIVQAEITAGQQVDTTTPLFTIADLATVWVEAPIFEGDLDKVDRESAVTIRSVGEEQMSWTGKPIYAGEVVDPLKRAANLLYVVDNATGRLKLGMSVTIAVPAGSEKQAVMVPEAALVESGGGRGVVYVRRSPTLFAEEEVTIGVRRDGLVAVAGEVKEGDDIVVVGAPALFGEVFGPLPVQPEEN
ncbi:MAG: efflux RND transporter periplasmic adaptor subunit [Deltaproteobacteria bacterium]|nr:efflux RND transporter periplasmic adaptor subunit [Deltaproteobacteria bacterium]